MGLGLGLGLGLSESDRALDVNERHEAVVDAAVRLGSGIRVRVRIGVRVRVRIGARVRIRARIRVRACSSCRCGSARRQRPSAGALCHSPRAIAALWRPAC